MDRNIRILAIVHCDTCHDTFNFVWYLDNEMIIESIFGIALTIIGGGDTKADPASMILKGLYQGNKIIQKEKNKEIDDSIHEESHQLIKDVIREIGK